MTILSADGNIPEWGLQTIQFPALPTSTMQVPWKESRLMPDAVRQASIPVLVETRGPRKSSRMPAGYNVLYMDGHVSLLRQNEAFPVQDKVQRLLSPPE